MLRKTQGNLKKAAILTALSAISLPLASQASDMYWTGGTSSYTDTSRWSDGTGTSDHAINNISLYDVVQINNGDPDWILVDLLAGTQDNTSGGYEQNGATVTVGNPGGWLRLGINPGSTGVYTLNKGTLKSVDQIHVGENGTAIFNMNGGTLRKTGGIFSVGQQSSVGTLNQTAGDIVSTSELWIGNSPTGNGTYNLSGGSISNGNWFVIGREGAKAKFTMTGGSVRKAGGGHMYVGQWDNGVAQFDFSGGTIVDDNEFWLGNGGASTGTMNMSGNATMTVGSWIAVGRGGTGILNMSDSCSITMGNGGNLVLPGNGTGTINQNGGTFSNTQKETWLPENGNGTWNLNAGTANLGLVIMCVNSGTTGALNVNGGTLNVNEIKAGNTGANSTLNLSKGTVRVNGNVGDFIHGIKNATVNGEGVTLDVQNFDTKISQAFSGTGQITKIGSGKLTLTGTNSYTGATVVSAGTLKLSVAATGAGDYTANDNTSLEYVSLSGSNSLPVKNLTLGKSTLNFDLGAFGNPTKPLIAASGALTVNGTVTVNIADALPQPGEFTLVSYASIAGSGQIVLGSLPLGVSANLVTNGNAINLNIVSVNVPHWDGQDGGVWDIGLTTNWINFGTGLATYYTEGSAVTFDDIANGVTTVTLGTSVKPSKVDFSNVTKTYTLTGTGKISGATGLNKSGNGVATVDTTNDFTGPVVITGGTLKANVLANGGVASSLGASSADVTNLVLNGGSLGYAGTTAAKINRGFTVSGVNSGVNIDTDLSLSGKAVAIGTSSFVKSGPAQFTFAGTGRNEFAVNANPGLHVAQGTMVLDGAAGSQTNHTVNDLWVGGTPATGGSLILTNGSTMLVDSWFAMGRGNGSVGNVSKLSLYNSAMQSGSLSLGYANGLPNNLASQYILLSGTSTYTNRGDSNFGENDGSSASITVQDNSVFFSQGRTIVGMSGGTTGEMVVANNGKVIINSGWFSIADNGATATMTVKDNASVTSAGDLNVTDNGAANATVVVQDNATLTANNIYVGKDNNATGILTINNYGSVVSLNGLTMAQHWNGDACVPTAAVVNLNGGSLAVNLVQGRNNLGVINFNGGRLIARNPFAENFIFNLASINILSGGAIIDSDNYDIAIAQPLVGEGGLTKAGTGALRLNGQNTYAGPTMVSAGTLAGVGSIAGSVTVDSGATLAPGNNGVGTLGISGALTFNAGSAAAFELANATSFDAVANLASVHYDGALVVTNNAGYGVFKLFNAASSSGNFKSVTVYPAASASFNPATGELTVSAPKPTITSPSIVDGKLIFVGTGGVSGASFDILTTTNVTDALSTWTTNTTGVFDSNGAYSNAIPVTAGEPTRYYMIKVQ